nr:glutathione S-transferase [Dendroctonus rhizophagus]
MPLKFYSTVASPPSLAVQQCLTYLDIPFELEDLLYTSGRHMSEEFAKINPQKELPVIDDNGFQLSESNAILQYLADKYPNDQTLYPKDVRERALVNHRLCFDLSTYYKHICDYAVNPLLFDYQKTPLSLKKTQIALSNFNTYLERTGTKYAATNNVTIADFQLVTSTMCLEAIKFDLSEYPLIQKWYSTYKQENPALWKIVEPSVQILGYLVNNPPDLSKMDHPIHPIRKN